MYLYIVCLLAPIFVSAHTIKGIVTDNNNHPLIGANVYWLGTQTGTITDNKGKFSIEHVHGTADKLIANYVGHIADTLEVKGDFVEFKLVELMNMKGVTVTGDRPGVIISDASAIRTEQITQTELGKAACCDLAGAFETQITVQPQTTNVVTNSKELRLLGLSGVYNQVLVDGFPMIQALSYTYGITTIPGTLVNNIFVSKGANSVLQGYDGITGQINVITRENYSSDKLLLNLYIDNHLEKQFNANYTFKTDDWSNFTAIHTTQAADKYDMDDDTFLDLPQLTRYMFFNKWVLGDQHQVGWNSKISLRYTKEQRIGGQMNFDADKDKGSSTIYGQTVNFSQPEITARLGYRPDKTNYFEILTSSYYQDQESYFGTLFYDAQQTNFYANLQYEMNYSTHTLKAGASFRYFKLDENISFTDTIPYRNYAGDYLKKEEIPGIFVENTMNFFDDALTWIAGVRADNHNKFGTMVTPRTLLKYNATDDLTLRANFGTGWRTTNIFSENINLLASSRDVIFAEELKPEKALNYGISLTQKFSTTDESISGHFMADFYRTDFQNQIFPDYDQDPTKAIIKNFEGTSVSNGFQAELLLNFWSNLEFKAGYNYLDVYRVIGGVNEQLPFNSKHKVFSTLSYKPDSRDYQIDVNMHWYGKQRLPRTEANPVEFQRPDYSEPYFIANAQFTYNFEHFKVYVGSENLFDFRQERPIISWENPFSPYFDTSSIWGPTMGRKLYLGITYTIPNDMDMH